MKILVVGGGAREHALCWKIAQSPKVDKIYCAPGNAGISDIAECVDIKVDHINDLLHFAHIGSIDLTVVGPELPLSLGIVDKFVDNGLNIFGPDAVCSKLESSKIFAKDVMSRYNIPTVPYAVFEDYNRAISFINFVGDTPLVVKADGLAAGKGVLICENKQDAFQAVERMMVTKEFGKAGDKIIIEKKLTGKEMSFMIFTDGMDFVPMVMVKDYKRSLDGDKGKNTGGVGSYGPVAINQELYNNVITKIVNPLISSFRHDYTFYKGVLYIGLMVENDQPSVLEFNVRFGDPEAQVIMLLLKTDLIDIMLNVNTMTLETINVEWHDKKALCTVLTSKGYPGIYEKRKVITMPEFPNKDYPDTYVFHAGTSYEEKKLVTAGGRVMGVTTVADSFDEARIDNYSAIDDINFEGKTYRRDI